MFDAAKLISNNVPNRDSPAPKLKHRFLCHVGGALLTVASTTLSICAVTSPAAAHQEFSDGTAQKVNEAAVQRDLAASTVSLAFGEAEAATCKTATAEAADAPTNLRQGILIDTDKSSIR